MPGVVSAVKEVRSSNNSNLRHNMQSSPCIHKYTQEKAKNEKGM